MAVRARRAVARGADALSVPVAARRRSLSRGGYTVVEVLIAMTVMLIGTAAVMTMHRASVQGNLDARRLDVATAVGRTWEERLQTDSMAWTQPNAAVPNAANLNAGNGALIADGLAHLGQWFLPGDYLSAATPESYGFDILGRDLQASDLGQAVFCVAVRFTTLVPGTVVPTLVRADVRVLWVRGLASNASTGFCPAPGATAGNATSINPAYNVYHSLYLTTSLAENPSQ